MISNRILDWLLQNNNPDHNTKVLAMCDFDAFSGELNFVFGEAHFGVTRIKAKVVKLQMKSLF